MSTDEVVFIDWLTVGPFQTNVYVFGCHATKEAAIVDAGGEAEALVALARDRGFGVAKILQTHAHLDHVAGLSEAKALTSAPIYLHQADLSLYDAAAMQGMMFGMSLAALPAVDCFIAEGESVAVGEHSATVIHLPGHTPGGVGFHFEELGVLFVGDVLFAGSIGRTDLPGGDVPTMRASLERLKSLPPHTRVLPGHGPETTIGAELRANPFLKGGW